LVKALNDEDSSVCLIAAEALSKIGFGTAIQKLAKVLNDENYLVRLRAAEALGNIGSDAAVAELAKALYDEDSYVRGSAAVALGKIGYYTTTPLETLNSEDSGARLIAADVPDNIGSNANISELVEALDDENFYFRRRAIKFLVDLGSYTAILE
jgi:HEAT repeat protein